MKLRTKEEMTADYICDLVEMYDAVFTSNADAANTMDYPEEKDSLMESILSRGVEAYAPKDEGYDWICEILDYKSGMIYPRFVFRTGDTFFTPLCVIR